MQVGVCLFLEGSMGGEVSEAQVANIYMDGDWKFNEDSFLKLLCGTLRRKLASPMCQPTWLGNPSFSV